MDPKFHIPDDLPVKISCSVGSALVSEDTKVYLKLTSGGGGDAAPSMLQIDNFITISGMSGSAGEGPGGGKGGGGTTGTIGKPGNTFQTKPKQCYQLHRFDIITWAAGKGGRSGHIIGELHGEDGHGSSIHVNGHSLIGMMFTGENPAPGGKGGRAPGVRCKDLRVLSSGSSGDSGSLEMWLAE